MQMRFPAAISLVVALLVSPTIAATYIAGSTQEARLYLNLAGNGDTVLLRPGEYDNLSFQHKTNFTLRSLDSANPAIIRPDNAGDLGLYIGNPNNVTVSDLVIDYSHHGPGTPTGNGIHIDKSNSPTFGNGLVLRNITVRQNGASQANGALNIDGLHMSGVRNFVFERLHFENWADGGDAIDIVGGYDGIIRNCYFKGAFSDEGGGVQLKGGARNVIVRANRFDTAGQRAMNLGGSTGLQFFEPGINFEAKNLIAEGNVIVGGFTPFAFTSSVESVYRHNFSYQTGRWLGRILREQTAAGFENTHDGKVIDNRFVWQDTRNINVGSDTEYNTFVFENNQWLNLTSPTNSRPRFDNTFQFVPETGGVYGGPIDLDPNRIIPWQFEWGLWLVNASLDQDTFNLEGLSPGQLYKAIPGAEARLDLGAANPLVGQWTFEPAGNDITLEALSDVVLVKQSLVPEPGGALAAWCVLAGLLCTRQRRRQDK